MTTKTTRCARCHTTHLDIQGCRPLPISAQDAMVWDGPEGDRYLAEASEVSEPWPTRCLVLPCRAPLSSWQAVRDRENEITEWDAQCQRYGCRTKYTIFND